MNAFRIVFVALVLLLGAASVQAQTRVNVVPGVQLLEWDQGASSLAEAQAFIYKLFVDGTPSAVPILPITCRAGATSTTFQCRMTFPAIATGDHAVQLSAGFVVDGIPIESLPSDPLLVRVVGPPGRPTGLRIVRAGS